jgi:hypothetical protein
MTAGARETGPAMIASMCAMIAPPGRLDPALAAVTASADRNGFVTLVPHVAICQNPPFCRGFPSVTPPQTAS